MAIEKRTPKIKQIAEVALVVSDLERSRKFYSEVLGLEEFKYDKLVPGTGLTFHLGTGYIGLWLPGEWPKINPHLGQIEDLGRRAHVVLLHRSGRRRQGTGYTPQSPCRIPG